MNKVSSFSLYLKSLMHSPTRVAFFCACFLFISTVLNGNIWRLWSLHRDRNHLEQEIQATRGYINKIDLQLKQAKDPIYLERQAKDRLDLVNEDDLVFVFPE